MKLPDKIRGFRSRVINELIDFCGSLSPISSPTIKHKWTNNGIVSESFAGGVTQVAEDTHFQVEMVSATSIKVHGGRWTRRAGNIEYPILLTTDAGTSGLYADVKTLAGITTTVWVTLTLDDALAPTTLTAGTNAAYLTTDVQKKVRYIAKITCASSVITAIEQLHHGDIEDFMLVPDTHLATTAGNSIAYDVTKHTAEMYLFSTAAPSGSAPVTDDICMRSAASAGVRTLYYATYEAIVATLGTMLSFITIINNGIVNYFGGAWADVKIHDHGDATWHTGLTDDDHTQYPLLTGTSVRNAMVGVIGDEHGVASINPDGRELKDQDGFAALTYGSTEWLVVESTHKLDVPNSTAATAADAGAVRTAGGYAGVSCYITTITAGSGGYYHLANKGTTNAGISSGGIVTGNIVRKRWADLSDDDEVLVLVT